MSALYILIVVVCSLNYILINANEMGRKMKHSFKQEISSEVINRESTMISANTSLYSKWSPWTRCEDCYQIRVKKCISYKCKDSRMFEERPCDKKRCKRKTRQKKTFNVVHLNGENRLETRQARSRIWSRWTQWSTCSNDCRTYRIRVCRKPGRCKKKRQKQTAYCYHENTRCEHYVMNILDTASKRNPNEDRISYNYNNQDNAHIRRNPFNRKCGRQFKKTNMLRIIGGTESKKYKWPWHVAVINRYSEVFCAGTLIAPRWVLTAGHCIRKYLRVRLNEHDLRAVDGREIEMVVYKMHLHPRFNQHTVDNDIALLRLPKAVKIPVACLPTKRPVPTELCSIMGWGKKKSSDIYGTSRLHEAKIPVINSDSCKRSYMRFLLTQNMFCAGWPSGAADTCAGDSGGGLICPAKTKPKGRIAYHIQGITSFGDGCGRKNKYGIYTMVYNYKPWISYIIENYS